MKELTEGNCTTLSIILGVFASMASPFCEQ